MKSILAKQAPQMSPCLPMRVRQTMQTGGRSRSRAARGLTRATRRRDAPSGFRRPWRYCGIRLAHRHGRHDKAESRGWKSGWTGLHERAASPVRPQAASCAARALRARDREHMSSCSSHVAREIAERVDVMLRSFPLALDLGAYHGLIGQEGRRSPICRARCSMPRALIRSPRFVRGRRLSARRICCRSRTRASTWSSRGWRCIASTISPALWCRSGARFAPTACSSRRCSASARSSSCAQALIEAEAESRRRREPARRAVRRCQGLWRAAAAGGLCAAGGRRRRAEGDLRLAPRADARGPCARRRQCALASAARRRCPAARSIAPKRSIANATRLPDGGVSATFEIVYLIGMGAGCEPAEAAQARQRRAAPRRRSAHDRAVGRRQGIFPGGASQDR